MPMRLEDLPVLPLAMPWGFSIIHDALTDQLELGVRKASIDTAPATPRIGGRTLRTTQVDTLWPINKGLTPEALRSFFDDLDGTPFRIDPDQSGEPLPIAWTTNDYSIEHSGPGVWRFSAQLIEVSPYDLLFVDDPIELFEISEYNLDRLSETIYICPIEGGVMFDGRIYEGLALQSEGYDLVGQGTPPSPKLVVSNLGLIVSEFLHVAKQKGFRLEGCRVKRRTTYKRFLDGEVDSNATLKERPVHDYVLEQASENYRQCEFVLVDILTRQGESIPNRLVTRGCTAVYRGPLCGYTGDAMFTKQRQPTQDKSLDRCDHTVAGCKLRFSGDLRHHGFPGVQRV
jgi:lambda family phage minor tail protein L